MMDIAAFRACSDDRIYKAVTASHNRGRSSGSLLAMIRWSGFPLIAETVIDHCRPDYIRSRAVPELCSGDSTSTVQSNLRVRPAVGFRGGSE